MKALILLAAVMISFNVLAVEKPLAIGGGFNVNFTNLRGSTGDSSDPVTSTTLVLAARYIHSLNDRLSFKTGVTIEEKSSKYQYEFKFSGVEDFSGNADIRISYLTVPLALQYHFTENVSVFGGYIPNLKINQYCNGSGDLNSCGVGEARTLVNYVTLGAAFDIGFLGVDLSYQHPLEENYTSMRINVVQLLFFYKL